MEKKTSPQTGLVWYELTENEWYGVSEDQRGDLRKEIQKIAQRDGFAHANIMVTPDPVMSVAPRKGRHCVFNWHDISKLGKTTRTVEREAVAYWKERALAAEKRLAELGE